ncbi:MAG: hypothetical protein Q8O40_11050 [Chloroflexota bacterium]|nr:hypothetical protein [Chloroflexota bacterium]
MTVITLKYGASCSECGTFIDAGEQAHYYGKGEIVCFDCRPPYRQPRSPAGRDEADAEEDVTRVAQGVTQFLRERTPEGVLGLLPDPPLELVEAAYRVFAKVHHPDRGGNPEKMKLLNMAVEELRKRLAARRT